MLICVILCLQWLCTLSIQKPLPSTSMWLVQSSFIPNICACQEAWKVKIRNLWKDSVSFLHLQSGADNCSNLLLNQVDTLHISGMIHHHCGAGSPRHRRDLQLTPLVALAAALVYKMCFSEVRHYLWLPVTSVKMKDIHLIRKAETHLMTSQRHCQCQPFLNDPSICFSLHISSIVALQLQFLSQKFYFSLLIQKWCSQYDIQQKPISVCHFPFALENLWWTHSFIWIWCDNSAFFICVINGSQIKNTTVRWGCRKWMLHQSQYYKVIRQIYINSDKCLCKYMEGWSQSTVTRPQWWVLTNTAPTTLSFFLWWFAKA